MTRYLVTGAGGMLGTELVAALAGREVTARIPRRARHHATPARWMPRCAVTTSSSTAPPGPPSTPPRTTRTRRRRINALGAELLARRSRRATARRSCTMSTDYVFDGRGTAPYPEDAPRDPVSRLRPHEGRGRGARARRPPGRHDRRAHRMAVRRGRAQLPADDAAARGRARDRSTWSTTRSASRPGLATSPRSSSHCSTPGTPSGIFHGTNGGQTSWWGFARAIFSEAGLDPQRVHPVDSSAYPQKARRPAYSVLGHDAWASAGLEPMRNWADALADANANGVMGSR